MEKLIDTLAYEGALLFTVTGARLSLLEYKKMDSCRKSWEN